MTDASSKDLDFPGTLPELLALRDTDPDRYEAIMTDVAKRAFAAQEKLLELKTQGTGVQMIEFTEFEKISRLNREVVVTEKIDGTNGQVHIRLAEGSQLEMGYDTQVEVDGIACYLRAGSRSRWVLHLGSDDNNGFGRWVHQHAHELAGLGVGAHFGEWWGQGIQRKYGLSEKRWSLFNVHRWGDSRPECCHVVPVITQGIGIDLAVERALHQLRNNGSFAAPGFMKPEGVVVFHTHARALFKVTLERDQEHKSQASE